jgi:hypothetical protein
MVLVGDMSSIRGHTWIVVANVFATGLAMIRHLDLELTIRCDRRGVGGNLGTRQTIRVGQLSVLGLLAGQRDFVRGADLDAISVGLDANRSGLELGQIDVDKVAVCLFANRGVVEARRFGAVRVVHFLQVKLDAEVALVEVARFD